MTTDTGNTKTTMTNYRAALTPDDIEEFGRELDLIRDEVMGSRSESDAQYIRRIIRVQRSLAVAGRVMIFASVAFHPQFFLGFGSWTLFVLVLAAGTLTLGLAKILENMEIGHNVMHGQWDWMRDPDIQSSTWEWDNVCPSEQWKHSHNVLHHTWTNVLGRDRDIGYGVLRIFPEQPWRPTYLVQPLVNLWVALFFEWGVAVHDFEFEKVVRGQRDIKEIRPMSRQFLAKASRQVAKDYILYPMLSGPYFFYVLAANAVANLIRNIWAYMIIFCGHFPAGAHTFTQADVENETRGHWYLRQLLGSCNIEGGRLFHILTGNLSLQIEHHLFPDMPSNRYQEVAPRVRALAVRYGLPYNSASLTRQYGTTLAKIFRNSLPTSPVPRNGSDSQQVA